jgi:hypothetical protein
MKSELGTMQKAVRSLNERAEKDSSAILRASQSQESSKIIRELEDKL